MNWENLIQELKKEMSVQRLASVGLFQKFSYDDETEDEELKKIVHLHRVVLDKALLDSFSPAKHIRKDVEDWLYLDNPDFIEACERALLKPYNVYLVFKTMKQVLKGKNAKFREFGRYLNKDKNNEDI